MLRYVMGVTDSLSVFILIRKTVKETSHVSLINFIEMFIYPNSVIAIVVFRVRKIYVFTIMIHCKCFCKKPL